MEKLSIGKIRGLQLVAGPQGIFTMCAMDHRDSLRRMINRDDPAAVSDETLVERKLELCSILAGHASAVLLDPIYGTAQCISHGVLPAGTGLLVSIEETGYEGDKEHRLTKLLANWSIEKIKRMGAAAAKILVHYRPDLKELARQQLATIQRVGLECLRYDLPFFVEPVSYPVGSEINNPRQFAARKGELVIQTARDITAQPVDVLKAEFPADLRYQTDTGELLELCRQLDLASPVPWVILSGGVDFDTFRQQVEIACQAGASGFLAGRAIWQEAIAISDTRERVRYLSTVSVDRIKKLTEIAIKNAVPWHKKLGFAANELAPVSPDWYKEYPGYQP